MNSLYLECNSGISGDMAVAAMIDLGADKAHLDEVIKSIPDSSFSYEIRHVKKSGIDCCDFDVVLESDNHDHDMEYLHGKDHEHHHMEEHGHEHHHMEEHGHEHHHHHYEHHHPHVHRSIKDVFDVIDRTELCDEERTLSKKIFEIIADAESKAHGISLGEVHFHEVGAIDSIVDIISLAVCFLSVKNKFNITDVIIPRIMEGTGEIRCQHGIIPIPVPATENIVRSHGLRLGICDVNGEFVTPTGAAIAAALISGTELPKDFSIVETGLGAGKRNYEKPSILRAMVISSEDKITSDIITGRILKLECNIDDCSGQQLSYTMDRLFECGAKDVYYTPVYMKKNRPAVLLSVLCEEADAALVENIIFKNTTTIGIRKTVMERSMLKREIVDVSTDYGVFKAKKCILPDGGIRLYPEHESVSVLARENDLAYEDAYKIIENGNK